MLAVPTYFYLTATKVHADAPDAPIALKGKTVRVRDLLAKRDGSEVWVVINGEVYE